MPSHRADTSTLRRVRPSRRAASGRRSATPTTSLSAPKVGIAGALGIATIAAPMSGAMTAPAPKAAVNALPVVSLAPAPAFPALNAAPIGPGVAALSVVPPATQTVSTPVLLAAPRTVLVERASRGNQRSVLPGCDGVVRTVDAPNGQLPSRALCTLWDGDHRLRADAAVALAKLNIAYKQRFGDDLCLTDSYRTLSEQVRLRSMKPGLAAVPGTSEHGWGLAVDLCDGVDTGTGSRFRWLRANAADFGWDNPNWARSGGSGPYEPWHWEFTPAG